MESRRIGWNAVSGGVAGRIAVSAGAPGGGAFMPLSGGEIRPVSGGGRPTPLSACWVHAANEATTARAMSIRMANILGSGSEGPA
jgi:hypothetical protein